MISSNNARDKYTTFDELHEPINPFLDQHEREHPPTPPGDVSLCRLCEKVGLPLCQNT